MHAIQGKRCSTIQYKETKDSKWLLFLEKSEAFKDRELERGISRSKIILLYLSSPDLKLMLQSTSWQYCVKSNETSSDELFAYLCPLHMSLMSSSLSSTLIYISSLQSTLVYIDRMYDLKIIHSYNIIFVLYKDYFYR